MASSIWLAVKKFMQHYYELYSESGAKFLESECRMLFLTYIRPLLNGGGFYYIEAETRNRERMDIVIDFNGEQFIVELKLWYGESSHEKSLEQLCGYLESKNANVGYLLTFDFRKENNAVFRVVYCILEQFCALKVDKNEKN